MDICSVLSYSLVSDTEYSEQEEMGRKEIVMTVRAMRSRRMRRRERPFSRSRLLCCTTLDKCGTR